MDNRLLNIYLSRILSGHYIFLFSGERYKLVYPDMHIKYEAELYALEEYEKNKFNDWIHDDAIVDTLVSMGVWSYNGDDNLKNLEKQIEDLKVELYQNVLNPNKIKTIKRTLKNTTSAYNKNYEIRHSLDAYTPLGYSQVLKNQYLLCHSIYKSNNKLLFNFNEDEIDSGLLNRISDTIISNTIDISIFREIARSDIWKNYWSSNNNNLFYQPTIGWTDEQKTLVVLTKMYDNAYQHPECPPDKVFEDDDMFDGWMISQRRENEKTRNKNRTEKMLEGKKLDKAGEIFVVANSQEEAQNIYDLNDHTSRHIIKERHMMIQRTSDIIEDSNLPDVQRNMVMRVNDQFKNSRK